MSTSCGAGRHVLPPIGDRFGRAPASLPPHTDLRLLGPSLRAPLQAQHHHTIGSAGFNMLIHRDALTETAQLSLQAGRVR
jgi:hypothetical protein